MADSVPERGGGAAGRRMRLPAAPVQAGQSRMDTIFLVARSAWTKTWVVSPPPHVRVTVALVLPIPLPVEATSHCRGTF